MYKKRVAKATLHLWGAISHSLGIALFGVALIVLVCLILLIFQDENNQLLAFGIGVVASVIASLLQKIFDKYWESYSTYKQIIEKVCDLLIDYEKDIARLRKQKNKLWEFYTKICAMSSHLLYTEDFKELSSELNKLVESVFLGDDTDVSNALEALNPLVDKLALEIGIR